MSTGRHKTKKIDASADGTTAEIIRSARLKSGMTGEEVAERLGLRSHASICHYESGRVDTTVSRLRRILAAMGYDLEISVKKQQKGAPKRPALKG